MFFAKDIVGFGKDEMDFLNQKKKKTRAFLMKYISTFSYFVRFNILNLTKR